ncbi:hypothetical protein GF362_04760 [Candidatus Dojkabacteria bacterium]|nr:hypothetical protein [Candidatus Dojkabacteria bacterium]
MKQDLLLKNVEAYIPESDENRLPPEAVIELIKNIKAVNGIGKAMVCLKQWAEQDQRFAKYYETLSKNSPSD